MSGTQPGAGGRIALRKPGAASIALNLTLFALVAVTVFGFLLIDTRQLKVGPAALKFLDDMGKMLAHPVAKHFSILEALKGILVTLALAFLTTLFGGVLALLLGPFAAKNLGNAAVSNAIKVVVALIRAIPTVIWVLIFAIGAGLGSVAAVVGMSFHSFSYLLKAYSESFEEVGDEVVEALTASGASWTQIVTQAVFPSSMGSILSWTFIRFEINFANAVAMGAAAGAGGIGYELFMASSFYFNIGEVGFITWLILAVAIGLEVGATRLRAREHVLR